MAGSAVTPQKTSLVKRKAGDDGELTPYAKRLPKPADKEDAAGADGAHSLLQEIISKCQKDASHILPVHGLIAKREQAERHRAECLYKKEFAKFGRGWEGLGDRAFKIKICKIESGLTDALLLSLTKGDDDSALNVLCAKNTQMSMAGAWPKELRCMDFCYQFMRSRVIEVKTPLKDAMTLKFIDNGEVVIDRIHAYSFKFATTGAKALEEITHIATGHQTGTKGTFIKAGCEVIRGWDDMNAHAISPPNPPMYLRDFFGVGTGPWSYKQFTDPSSNKITKTLKDSVADMYKTFRDNVVASTAGSSEDGTVAAALKAEAKQKASVKMRDAQLKVKQKASERSAKLKSKVIG